jgi:hypothetical protein
MRRPAARKPDGKPRIPTPAVFFGVLGVALVVLGLVFWLAPTSDNLTTVAETSTTRVTEGSGIAPKVTEVTKNTTSVEPGEPRADSVLGVLLGTGAVLLLVSALWGRIAEIGLPGGASIKLLEAEVPKVDLDDVAERLQQTLAGASAAQASVRMTSASQAIIDKAKEAADTDARFVPVDLGVGNKWLLPNLYFLALVLERWTDVVIIVFTKPEGDREDVYVACARPQALRDRLSAERPDLAAAAQSALDDLDAAGQHFFSRLAEQLQVEDDQEAAPRPPTWVDASLLLQVARAALILESVQIQPEGDVSAKTLGAIIDYPLPCVPVTRADGRLAGVIDQSRIALEIARNVTR